MRELDVEVADGCVLHAYDTGEAGDGRLPVVWHHGTPNIGAPPEPLFPDAERLGLRWVSYDRPGYGGSTPRHGRDVASAAGDVAAVADAVGVERFGVMGHSGGSAHAMACGVLLPGRVVGVVCGASLAPRDAEGLDWEAGMIPSGVVSLRAAADGRDAKEAFEASGHEYDPEFNAADMAMLEGPWSWLGRVVGPAVAQGPGGLIDDDLAYVAPWGFDPADATVPALFLHGDADGIAPGAHGRWLAERWPGAELRLVPGAGHISVLAEAPAALDWLRALVA